MNGGFQRCQHTWCYQKTHPCIYVRNKAMLGNGYRLGGSVGTDLKEGMRKFGKEAQGTSRIVGTSPCKFGKPKGQSPCKDTYTRNLITGKTCLNKVGSTSKSLASQGMQNPKSKSDLEQNQKALVKVNPKRRRERKKTPKRSTAGNIEQPLDDDGIWFECNVPFRVNIPFPISMKNLFGSQLFQGNSNYQILKAVVPEGKFQKNSKLEWPLSFSMRPALPNPDLQSSNSSTKAIAFTKKKGFRRGNKASPCETSTQTIEEESDPVLICLEQIRNQLAGKTSEGQEKNLSRCFAEKSTNESSIQSERNEAGVENSKQSSPNEPIEPERDDKSENSKPSNPKETASVGSFKNSSSRNSLNTLPQPKSETNNKEKKSTPPKTQAKSNADSSSVSTESQKKSEEKVEANSIRKDENLKKPKETDKKTNFVCVPTPILKPHICLCRIPRVIPKFTRVMMPSTVCQPHFMGGCRMPKWQNHRQSNQHYCQCIHAQGHQTRMPSTTASRKDAIQYEEVKSVSCEKPMSMGKRGIMKRESVQPNRRLGDSTLNKNICFRDRISTYSQSTEMELPKTTKQCPRYDCSYTSSRTNTDCDYRSSNSEFRSSKCVKSKSSQKSSDMSVSNSSYTATSERECFSEGSKTKEKCPKESSPERNSNISSHESRPSSRKTSHSSLKNSSKTKKSSQLNEVKQIVNKNQDIPRNQTRNKRKQPHKNRMSSGGETFPENSTDCDHDEVSEVAEAQTPSTSKNSISEALKASHSKSAIDIKESSISRNSDHLISERNTRKESSQESEKRNPDQRINLDSHQNAGVNPKETTDQSCNTNREVSFRQRSNSAPECCMLQFAQGNQTNRSEKPHPTSEENCKERHSCPENVLVLKDETCESDSDDYELVRCNDISTEEETVPANCPECETPNYSINASIINQLRNEESSISSTQSQITFILADDQRLNDLNISQQDQGREKPPMVQVPFRMSSTEELGISQPKQLRKLGLKFTRLNTNQLQMAPATTRHLPLQTQKTKRMRNRNCNSSVGQMNGVFVLASSPSTRTDTAGQSTERRNRNLQHINHPGGSHSLSNNPPSLENRRKAPSQTSYPVLRRIQRNDSNNSQSRRFISVSSQYPEQLNMYYENQHRQDEYRTCNRNNSDQSHRDSHQNEERSHNSAIVGASGYSTDLTWTDLPPNSRLVAPNTSTDVETLETVTLMHPRKLRSCESAGNRNQANANENIVLIETTTPCNREILLQACGRPPCNSCTHHYTGLPPSLHQGFTKPPDHMLQPQISVSAPQNITPFDEGFLIDPRDQWMTTKSPASAPAMQHQFQMKEQCQPEHRSYHQFQEPVHTPDTSSSQPRNHGYNPQLKENIRMLPDGFYERTVNKYNITRMDSNFQPPEFSLQPDFLHGEQHPTFRQHSCPYSNQYHHPQLMMTAVPDPNRRYIPPQNQYPAEMFWPQQNVHLDYYDQSEYQI
ncbi:uncharacterized protein LOC117141463 isoform X2 [Drosophila mauritiana]|uniref:Uncharacterized protein LOC117141463 isoform X2 n=1 Tax=Drosophila mauritiana TaxID=7226 RepID=A0A6P8JVG0_DROMA|nr:uncharacterized protein LOC117141463 isoform X2 [Drosophila mauritiana]